MKLGRIRGIRVFSLVIATFVLSLSCFCSGERAAVRLPILMYHQVSIDPEALGPYTISPEMFEQDLIYLQSHGYTTVTVKELEAYANGTFTLPDKPVMLTFDDGYESLGAYVLPLLEQYKMHAVLSVVGEIMDIYTAEEDHHLSYSFFSWPGLKALNESEWVEIASHTYGMHWEKERQGCAIMSGESQEAYRALLCEDIERQEGLFQQYLEERPAAFAYPFGHYCKESREILGEYGYHVLFTTDQKVNLLTGNPAELLDLGRYNRASTLSCEQIFTKIRYKL